MSKHSSAVKHRGPALGQAGRSATRAVIWTLLPLGLLATLSACSRERLIVLFPTGDVAIQQRNLIALATVLMLTVVIPVIVMTIVFARKYSAKRGGHDYDPTFDHSTGLELA